jgi:hypothetical protein
MTAISTAAAPSATAPTVVSRAVAPATPTNPVAAARAKFLKTGVDKDAAAGDPDHDAGPKAHPSIAPKSASIPSSPTTAIASGVPTLNATPVSGSPSLSVANAAYTTLQKK